MKDFAIFRLPTNSHKLIAEIEFIEKPMEFYQLLPENHPEKICLKDAINSMITDTLSDNLSGKMFIIKKIHNLINYNYEDESYNFENKDDEIIGKYFQVKSSILGLHKTFFIARESDVQRGSILKAESAEDALLFAEVNFK